MLSEEYGILNPKTYYYEDYENINKLSKNLHYPVVIKQRISTRSKGVLYAYNEKDFKKRYIGLITNNMNILEYPIIQNYIQGEAYGVSLLYNHGEKIANFVHKRLREYPITGGPSTYRISVKNKKIENISQYMLDEINWHGFAMFEYKINQKNNTPYLLEVNPRLVGSLNQAISSGVDFPWLIHKIALGEYIEPIHKYRLGVKTKNYFPDIVSIIQTVNKTGKISDFNILDVRIKDDVLSLTDPMPLLRFIYLGFRDLLNTRTYNSYSPTLSLFKN